MHYHINVIFWKYNFYIEVTFADGVTYCSSRNSLDKPNYEAHKHRGKHRHNFQRK